MKAQRQFMGPVGFPEMFAIFIIALLLFGPKKLPELGRTLGKALSEFRRAKNELKSTFESHMQELEREARISEHSSTSSDHSPGYSYPYEEYNRYDPEAVDYSAPAQVGGTETNAAALPPPEAAEPAEAGQAEHEIAPAAPAVNGTVARTNGVRPLEHTPETAAREEHAV
jgi:sec-independent protein translocase protein TatA